MMVSWPLVRAEMQRNPPRSRPKSFCLFWLGFWTGGVSVAAMILAWRLYLPVWTLGI
jgi:hypothetical protein